MITSGMDTVTRKWWKLEVPGSSYSGTEPEVSRALTAARIAFSLENPPAPDAVDFWDGIKVTVEDGAIVISYEVRS